MKHKLSLLLAAFFISSGLWAQTLPDIHPNKRQDNPRLRSNNHIRTEPAEHKERKQAHHSSGHKEHKERLNQRGGLKRR